MRVRSLRPCFKACFKNRLFIFSGVVAPANRIKSRDDKSELPILKCHWCTLCMMTCVDGVFCSVMACPRQSGRLHD